MSVLAFIIGLALPGAIGWCSVRLCEGRSPLLHPIERGLYALLIGPIMTMEVIFLLTWAHLANFTLIGFLIVQIVLLAIMGGLVWKKRMMNLRAGAPHFPAADLPQNTYVRYGVYALVIWVAIRFFFGAFNLTQLPTYWDDTIDNWNMRGKAFYIEKNIILELPNINGTLTDKGAESSYPPAVPLMKTWLTTLRGDWSEGLVNAIHAVWYACLIGLFFFILRRRLSLTWSIVGTYFLASQPLVLIQGVNPYVDVLVAACVLGVIGALLSASEHAEHRTRWLMIAALTLGAATFTKNEVLPLHLPPLALALIVIGMNSHKKAVLSALTIVAAFLLPWLAFKWSHGLTFGNAKAVSGLTIGWYPEALEAVWNMLMKEANFLLTPLVLVAVLIFGKGKMTRHIKMVLAVLACVFCLQLGIYAFTPLATEAIRQTGLGRGLLQLTPLAMLVTILLAARVLKADDE